MGRLLVPILIFIAASVISIIVIVLSRKKTDKNVESNKDNTNVLPDLSDGESSIVHVEKENNLRDIIMSTNTQKDLPEVDVVPVTPKEETIIPEEPKEEGPLPTIDIPIPDTSDSPITVEEVKSIVENNEGEEVYAEEIKRLEETYNNDELVKVEDIKQEEVSEPIITEEETLTNASIEEVKTSPVDFGETAFKSTPDGNTTINTDIKVDPIQDEYTKTEIFNLDDIKEELKRIEDENKRDTV